MEIVARITLTDEQVEQMMPVFTKGLSFAVGTSVILGQPQQLEYDRIELVFDCVSGERAAAAQEVLAPENVGTPPSFIHIPRVF